MTKLLALTCYAMLLMPGFLQGLIFFFFSLLINKFIERIFPFD